MVTSNNSLSTNSAVAALVPWINRALEALWLLTVVLVPLIFFDPDFAFSEAVISYVEVPKIALLRTLVALMAILWLVKWSIEGHSGFGGLVRGRDSSFFSMYWLRTLRDWLIERPIRWLFLAVWFFLGTTLLSTFLSGSFDVSMWGEVPGQDGYPAYTIVAYVVLFGIIATHLKTRAQLWRLIGALVLMGALASGYAILQHYDHDFFELSEITGGDAGGQVTSFMGNAIFGAAVMSMTIPITLVAATISFREPVWPSESRWTDIRPLLPSVAVTGLWAAILTVELLGITFTFSRGPWVGMMAAIGVFLGLAALTASWRAVVRAVLVLGLTGILTVSVLHGLGSLSILGLGAWLSGVMIVAGFIGVATAFLAWRYFGRWVLVLGLAGVLVVAALLAPAWLKTSAADAGEQAIPAGVASDSTATQVEARFSSIRKDVLSGLLAGRSTHWNGSWQLIRGREWFDFDTLSLGWLRPLIGYGPELFRYTYLLVSPSEGRDLVPLEPDHAHNFFIHQTVEQGILGLLSSLGLFMAVFIVGGKALLRRGEEYSPFYKIMLIGLVATVAGRFIEMMVGVARVSDLTILWVVLAAVAALPGIMQFDNSGPEQTTSRRRNRPRRNRDSGVTTSGTGLGGSGIIWRLAIVALLIGGIGPLTWIKGVNNVRAAVEAGDAVENFREGDYQAALSDLDRAIVLAPDVSVYYNHKASVYRAFRINQLVPPEEICSSQNEMLYEVCLEAKGFESNIEGSSRRPFYYRSQLAVANSAFNLKLDDVAVRQYEHVLALVPDSWRLRDELGEAYLELGQPENAIKILEESIAISQDTGKSTKAYFFLGKAHREIGDLPKAADSFKRSLELVLPGEHATEALEIMTEVYESLGQSEIAARLFFVEGQRAAGTRHDITQLGESFETVGEAAPSGDATQEAEHIPVEVLESSVIHLGRSVAYLERSMELGLPANSELTAIETLAEVHARLGELGKAAEYFFLVGEAYWEQEQLQISAKFLEKSLTLTVSADVAVKAHQLLVEVYTGLGQTEAAEEHRQP